MNYGDEISNLAKLAALQRENGKTDPVTEELIEGLLTVVKELASDLEVLTERLKSNEEFTESLSDDLFDIQSIALKGVNDGVGTDLAGVDLAELFAQMNADDDDEDYEDEHGRCECGHDHHHEDGDDEGTDFVRCPFCNTLIFGDPSAKKFECPFCGGSFTQDDIG